MESKLVGRPVTTRIEECSWFDGQLRVSTRLVTKCMFVFIALIFVRYNLESCEVNSQNYVEKQHIESSDQIRQLSKPSLSINNASRL